MAFVALAPQFMLSFLFLFQAKPLDNLLVYGDGFSFSVKEPNQRIGDTDNAERYGANVILYPEGHDIEDPNGVIRVRVNGKTDENIADDLSFDMDEYKKQYSDIQFQDIMVKHPLYQCYAKLFFVRGKFYEYVTYINPGKKVNYSFSVAMNIEKKPATPDELAAYREVIASLRAVN